MVNGIWQSCYTNSAQISNGVVAGAGWGFVAQSLGLTSDAVKGVGAIQGKNSKMSGLELDEAGKILDLYEVDGDKSYIYVTRTRSGCGEPAEYVFTHIHISLVGRAGCGY